MFVDYNFDPLGVVEFLWSLWLQGCVMAPQSGLVCFWSWMWATWHFGHVGGVHFGQKMAKIRPKVLPCHVVWPMKQAMTNWLICYKILVNLPRILQVLYLFWVMPMNGNEWPQGQTSWFMLRKSGASWKRMQAGEVASCQLSLWWIIPGHVSG